MKMTETHGWIWPKHMVEFDRNRRTLLVWTWPNIDNEERSLVEHDRKWLNLTENWYSPVNVPRCGDIYYIFYFRSYSPVKVHRCGNIYYIFGHVHHVKVCRCQFFGHVHKFWSNSFGHLHSVKLTFLDFTRLLFKYF